MKAPLALAAVLGLATLLAQAQQTGTPTAVALDALATLRQQVDAGNYDQAYEAARQHPDWEGNPHFDFLFGVSAIRAGHIPEGLLALERHLAVVPANDRARLELARGYFELGEYVRARQEFEFVLKYNPPKEVQANIQRYLDAMQTRDTSAQRASARAYMELGGGHDSNVNAGTYNSVINLPIPVVIVDRSAQASGALFWQAAGGGQWLKRVSPQLAVFAGGDLDSKRQPAASSYNTTNVGGYLGFSVFNGAMLYRLSLSDGVLLVADKKYRNTLSVTGEAQYSLGNGLGLNGVAQYAELSHAAANSTLDSKLVTLVGGLQKSFQVAWRPTVGLQLSYADESNIQRRDDLSRRMLSGRISLSANPMDRLGINGGLSWQHSDFDAADIAFHTVRKDYMWTADFSVNFALDNRWSIRTEAQVSQNDSNQNLYAYRRTLVGVKTRYQF